MNTHSFLPSSQEILHSMISGIMESYENPWDILAELAQNSMDAIHEQAPPKGHVSLHINAPKATITFSDNGVGIDPSDLKELFVPYGSNKRTNPNTIGEKGVGLKFVIFSTNKFSLVSHHNKGSFEVTVKGAAEWLISDNDSEISFTSKKIKNPDELNGVTVKLSLHETNHPLFKLSLDQLKMLLLTKTAIGSTAHIWGEKENCDLELTLTDMVGEKHEVEVECEFTLPIENVKKTISIVDYDEWKADSDRSDQQKRKKLKNAIIYNQGTSSRKGRDIKHWSCMTPSRMAWASMAVNSGLVDESEESDFNSEDHFYAQSNGVFLSTKYMPTGVRIDLRATGESGYTNNFFIILEDKSLKFDIGRKGVPPRTSGLLRKIAQEEFKKYLQYKRFIRGESETTNSQFAREDLFKEILALPDLKSKETAFIKRPNSQEATVAAIFYEQMGKGKFSGFTPYTSGYRDKYDLTGTYEGNNLVIEFKHDLTGLFNDFTIARKLFDEINVVIVWEITEDDRTKASDRGIDIEEIDDDDRIFPNTHYSLEIDSVAPVEVLEIKKLL